MKSSKKEKEVLFSSKEKKKISFYSGISFFSSMTFEEKKSSFFSWLSFKDKKDYLGRPSGSKSL